MSTTPKLSPGDAVALVSFSSAVPEERLQPAVDAVRALGLEPVVYPSCYYVNRYGNFAATDTQRAQDVTDAFSDPAIRGVLAIRGGYGAGRVLPLLDIPALAGTGKYFSGYSDVTALHIALNQAGLVTFHTVMPSTEYYQPVDGYTLDRLRDALFGTLTGIVPFPEGWQAQTIASGVAEGVLVGGNLSLVRDSLGTPWEIDTKGKILFLEDVDEEPYRIDGMLTQLANAGKLADCAGVMLGYWTRCVPRDSQLEFTLDEFLDQQLAGLGKPVLKGLPCGHDLPSLALPMGALVRLDGGEKTLEVLE